MLTSAAVWFSKIKPFVWDFSWAIYKPTNSKEYLFSNSILNARRWNKEKRCHDCHEHKKIEWRKANENKIFYLSTLIIFHVYPISMCHSTLPYQPFIFASTLSSIFFFFHFDFVIFCSNASFLYSFSDRFVVEFNQL